MLGGETTMAPSTGDRVRVDRVCLFCGGRASVLVSAGASELDVDAEFSGGGREFASVPDGDPIGVGCYRCSRKQWRRPTP